MREGARREGEDRKGGIIKGKRKQGMERRER